MDECISTLSEKPFGSYDEAWGVSEDEVFHFWLASCDQVSAFV